MIFRETVALDWSYRLHSLWLLALEMCLLERILWVGTFCTLILQSVLPLDEGEGNASLAG